MNIHCDFIVDSACEHCDHLEVCPAHQVSNFSRHDLNVDQVAAIKAVLPSAQIGETLKPFFTGADDVRSKLNGKVSVAVVPGAMLLEVEADQGFAEGTVILAFEADQAARKRGRFAARGLKVFEWVEKHAYIGGPFVTTPRYIGPVLTSETAIVPTVENNFSDGQEFPYEEGVK